MSETHTPRLVIIGSGAGGLPIASHLTGAGYEITVYTLDEDIAYSPCGIPFVIGGSIPSFESLTMKQRESYRDVGINIQTARVERIDTDHNRIYVRGGPVDYDYLVIATGTRQRRPDLEGVELPGVFSAHFKPLREAVRVEAYRKKHKCKRAAILGSGSVDLEMAMAYNSQDMEVTVIEKGESLLPDRLDPDMAAIVASYLEDRGIEIITSSQPTRITPLAVELDSQRVPADLVLLGTDFLPETRLAREDGITVRECGIVIDKTCRVKKGDRFLENVFASGACSCYISKVTGRECFTSLGSNAIKKARVISGQLRGLSGKSIRQKHTLPPITNPRVTVLGELHIGAVGITSLEAETCGIKTTTTTISGKNTSRYYPSGAPLHLKLIFEKNTDRLLGGQVISWGHGAKERIDALSIAMSQDMTLEELLAVETAYSPPASSLTDPLTEALQKLGK